MLYNSNCVKLNRVKDEILTPVTSAKIKPIKVKQLGINPEIKPRTGSRTIQTYN